jgi:hypothetical protein
MSMYRDSCAREGFKADLRHPDVYYRTSVRTEYDTVWNRYGYVTTCRLRYVQYIIGTVQVQIYIDQCKDTYCKGREWVPCIPVKLKERMPNIAVYMAYRSKRKQSAVSRRRRMFSSIGRSPAVSRTVSVGG